MTEGHGKVVNPAGFGSASSGSNPDAPASRFICKCECGGDVRGVEEFGRLWTWCESCSPVIKFKIEESLAGYEAFRKHQLEEIVRVFGSRMVEK